MHQAQKEILRAPAAAKAMVNGRGPVASQAAVLCPH